MPEPERVTITTSVANRMRKARTTRGLSQSELAKRVRVPRARIKRIECHELESLDAGEYARLATALGMTRRVAKKKATKRNKREQEKMRVRAARAVLEQNGLLDVTLGDLLKI
jgi:ribosome-binding protein aMBF1 (putative translation factor)